MNVILTGMRGTGKSSIGRQLAAMLGYTFVDTDARIEARAGARIADIVARHGWEHFRALERQVVARVASDDHQVISTGGGTLIDPENAAQCKAGGLIVLLICAIPVLQRRLRVGTNRPSLTGNSSAVDELAPVWEARRAQYQAVADLTYDVSVESTNHLQDIQRKAAAVRDLLHNTPRFHSKDAK